MIFTTNSLSALRQPEFEIQLNNHEFAQVDFDFLNHALVEMARSGATFAPGQLIQIGWIACRITSNGHTFGLEEPDFEMFPIRWIPGATTTMMHLRIHTYVADSLDLGDAIQHASIFQSAVVCDRFSLTSGIYMERVSPTDEDDSGWNILCADPEHAHNDASTLRRESIYEVALVNPNVHLFVGLPHSSSLLLPYKGFPQFFLQGKRLPIAKESYLDRRFYSIRPH
ncbi:MAG: hypothetical protein K8S54_17530 [Spirochaetia bacterium]|nr:hypothetical protein [Spirochaetia bacterium]